MWLTTFMRSWQDFEFITLAMTPMMLFTGTFFPLDALAGPLRWLIEATPLYRGVVLCRELTTGAVTSALALGGVSGRAGFAAMLGERAAWGCSCCADERLPPPTRDFARLSRRGRNHDTRAAASRRSASSRSHAWSTIRSG